MSRITEKCGLEMECSCSLNPVLETPASPDEIDGGDDQQCEHGCRDHSADHRRRDALHHIGTRSLRPHDGEQIHDDGRGGHEFGANLFWFNPLL